MPTKNHRRTRSAKSSRLKIAGMKPQPARAILIGNPVTTSAELPTIFSKGVVYSEGVAGIGPAGNVSERNTKSL